MIPVMAPHGQLTDPGIRRWLDVVDPELAAMRRMAFSGREATVFEFGKAAFCMRFVADAAVFDAGLGLHVRIGHASGWLLFESYDVLGEEWATVFQQLDPVLVRALLIDELTQHFEALARLTRAAVQLVDLQVGIRFEKNAPVQALRLENRATGVGVRLALRAESADFFTQVAALLAQRRPHIGAPPTAASLRVSISPGSASIPLAEIQKMRAGDILVLDQGGNLAALQAACFDYRWKRLPIRALLEGRGGRLIDYEGDMMARDRNEIGLAESGAAMLEKVVVPITAVIGELELPLRVFSALGAGYVFELPTELEQATVQLYTGSHRVGVGRLVAVGERLGVRVLEWGGGADGEPA
jgi:type III secretion system YscQ/HrcQ family protein